MAKKKNATTGGQTSDTERKKIPAPIQHQLLMEAGYKCGNPACRNVITLEIHHIVYVRDGGGNDATNLLVLCPYCHSMHHAGQIPEEAIRHWKGMLLALNNAFDRGSLDLLLYLRQTHGQEIWYTGDALLRFAGLIAAGLVTFKTEKLYGMTPTTSGHMGTIPTVFHGTSYELGMKVELELTDKGNRLVEAWRSGNEQAYRTLISSQPVTTQGRTSTH
ncbi:MAG TPA: HNH endonuclease signature motif containing protein [Gemmataceae bacterium]|nr:HNH endonuclease signature motif containing protein [Gemmataceae bacterium]